MTFSTKNLSEVQILIGRLRRDMNARAVFLANIGGDVIASDGESDALDSSDLRAPSEAGLLEWSGLEDFSANERDDVAEVQHSIREGSQNRYHLSRIRMEVVLIVVFDETSLLGLVRMRVRKVIPELIRLLFTCDDSGPSGGGFMGGGGSGGGGDEARTWVDNSRDIGRN